MTAREAMRQLRHQTPYNTQHLVCEWCGLPSLRRFSCRLAVASLTCGKCRKKGHLKDARQTNPALPD